ncbi:TNF receptor-associated factor 2 isoform X2 [Rhipicephalus microplus]|uniref:TNF receptor-associated factor 2 isoform X2 n=1 Tax=Rhipicephalus microplus TaxID=6941 RepID=UPI003F6ABB11
MQRCPNGGCRKEISETELKEHSKTCRVKGDEEKSVIPKSKGASKKKSKSDSMTADSELKELRRLLNAAMREIAELKLSQSIQERKTAALLRRTGASFIWCLESYRRLRRHAISRRDDCLSEPIFFGLAGCKFRLQVNLYGVGGGAGTHMAFFVQFKVVDLARMDSCCVKKTRCLIRVASQREGVDHVDHTFEFCVSGQDRRRSTSRPLHMWNTLFGREKFILFEELEDQRVGYVVDDMLILEFHVID